MGFDLRRGIAGMVLFVTAALLTLMVARLQGWPFAFYELVLIAECAFIVMRGITAPPTP